MDLALQVKLLRVLQEREVRRVGGQQSFKVDFRLVSATNRALEKEVALKRFRLDLLYRLEVVKIKLPPLRQRVEDIPVLARHFLEQHARRMGRPVPALRPSTLRHLLRYSWPGNIRELENEMWRAVALGHTTIHPADLSVRIRSVLRPTFDDESSLPAMDLKNLEKDLVGAVIAATLRACGGNATRAAGVLGIPRSSLYRKARRYGLDLGSLLSGPTQSLSELRVHLSSLERLLEAPRGTTLETKD
jgi:DNA-binding NtrC family response regulator